MTKETVIRQRLSKKANIAYHLLLSAKSFGLGLKALKAPLVLNANIVGHSDFLYALATNLSYIYNLIARNLRESGFQFDWYVDEGKKHIALRFNVTFHLQIKPKYYLWYDIWYYPAKENKIIILYSYEYYENFTEEERIISKGSVILDFPRSKEEFINKLWEIAQGYIKIRTK